ncbi:MAG: hypothetical protein CM1200mP10_10410 [Candidatus Neomarinimicrobiota bacterium]|nr:MAG: hypothetical protein CM1200mP10_10410 [Candidatus Neomarinimicrobiota bacterium]
MMDCFIANRLDDQYIWSCGGINHYTKKSFPARFYDKFDDLTFKGKKYFIPSHVEDYLTFRYGDWKTPQEKWDYRRDDGAIIYSRVVLGSERAPLKQAVILSLVEVLVLVLVPCLAPSVCWKCRGKTLLARMLTIYIKLELKRLFWLSVIKLISSASTLVSSGTVWNPVYF